MAEQMPIISSRAEPTDGAWKDNVKEAPAEQAQDKKVTSPEKLNCDSSNLDSGSGSEKVSARGDGGSIVEKKKKKKVVKEKAKKKSSGKKKEDKLQCDSSDSDSVSSVSSSCSDSVSSDSTSDSDSCPDPGKSRVKEVNMDEKEKSGVMDQQIKEKFSKKSKEGVEVPEKAIDKLECKSSDSDSCSESSDDSKSCSDDASKSGQSKLKKKEENKKEPEKKAQEKSSGGPGEHASAAAPEKPMEVEDAQEEKGILEKIKGQLIGHGEPTEGQQQA